MKGFRKQVLSGEAQIKPYMNEITSEEKEKRRIEGDQSDNWFKTLEQKAAEFYDEQGLSFKEADQFYASNYDRMRTKMYEQAQVPQTEVENSQIKVEHSSLVEPQHMSHYNGFLRLWKQYQVETEQGPQYYWHNEKLKKSTWESPVMIWKALQEEQISNSKQNMPLEWDPIPDTPFLKIKVKGLGQAGSKKYFFLHKPTLKLFKENPFVQKNEEQQSKEQPHESEVDQEEELQNDTPLSSNLLPRKATSRIISLRDFEEEYLQFCEMLLNCKIDPLSTYDRELPKFISDERVSLIPKQLRREAFEKYCRENEAKAIQIRESVKQNVSQQFRKWLEIYLSTQEEFLDYEAFQIQKRNQSQFLKALYELTTTDLKQIYQSQINKEAKKRKKFKKEIFQFYVREHYSGEANYQIFKEKHGSSDSGISEKEKESLFELEVAKLLKQRQEAVETTKILREEQDKLKMVNQEKKEESSLRQFYEEFFKHQIIDWESSYKKLQKNQTFIAIQLNIANKKSVFQQFQKETYFMLQKSYEALIQERSTPRTAFNEFESECYMDARFKNFPKNDAPYVFQRFQELREIEWKTQLETLIDQTVEKEGKKINSIPRFHELLAEDKRYSRFSQKDALWWNQMVLQYAEKKYSEVLPFLAD